MVKVLMVLLLAGVLASGEAVADGERIEIFHLRVLDATEIAAVATQLLARLDAADGRVGSALAAGGGGIRVAAERRSNALIVRATARHLDVLRRLLVQLDAPSASRAQIFPYGLQHAKAKDLVALLSAGELVDDVRYVADEASNTVIVLTSATRNAAVASFIAELDRPPRQVWLEAIVGEISVNHLTTLGVDWAGLAGAVVVSSRNLDLSTATLTSVGGSLPTPTFPGFTGVLLPTSATAILINALEAEGRLRVVARPSIVAMEGKKASINVSESIPIVTAQAVTLGQVGGAAVQIPATTSQTVEYRDVGIILTLTPRIGPAGTLTVDIKQEASELGPPEAPTGSRRILQRKAETSVVLSTDRTMVLGGVLRDRDGLVSRGVPVLKDVPIVGPAFGLRTRTVDRVELAVFVTAHLIPPPPAPSPPTLGITDR